MSGLERLKKNGDLEKQIASAESQLRLHPIWLWGFWILFRRHCIHSFRRILDFSANPPRVFEQPHDRSIRDLKESQMRVRSFPHEEGT